MSRFSERDLDYLAAVLDHCDKIAALIKRFGESLEAYQDALLMNIFQIGEAANKLSDDCINGLHGIPWHAIIGTRNVIAHGYIKINYEVIWNTAISDIPMLKKQLEPELL